VRDGRPTEATAADRLTTDQEPHELTIIVAVLVVLDAFALVLVTAFADQVGKNQAAQTPAAYGADSHGAASETTAALVLALIILDAFALTLVLSALADQVGENQTAQAPTANGAAEKHARQAMILLVALVILDAFAFVVFSAGADHVGENQPAQAPTASRAADQDAYEPIVFVAAFFLVDALVVIHIRPLPVAKEPCDEQAPHALAAADLAAGQ
jgi:hypothetical protein